MMMEASYLQQSNKMPQHEPLNVLVIAKNLDIGGTQTHIRALSKQLLRYGHRVVALSAGGNLVKNFQEDGIEHHYLVQNLNVDQLKKSRINPRSLNSAFDLINFINLIVLPFGIVRAVRIARQKQIHLIHSHSTLAFVVSLLTAKILGIPSVITLHNYRGMSLSLPFLFRHVDKIIVISKEIEEKILELDIDPQKIAVIPNMIEVDDTLVTNPPPLTIPDIRSESLKIVTVSRLDLYKTDVPQNLISTTERIITQYPELDIQIIIVGGGSELRRLQTLGDQVNQKLGRQTIVFTGFRKDAIHIISNADIVLGSGRVVLEAMALGKPTIVASAQFGGILNDETFPQLAQYNFSGRNSKEKTSTGNIYQAIITLLENNEYRSSVGKIAYRLVQRSYTVDAVTTQIQDVYRQALTYDQRT
jgi:glycosyltransferase involved in cell wall biosynthesis